MKFILNTYAPKTLCLMVSTLLFSAASASAGQKIISFLPASKADIIKQIGKAGGKVTKEFHIIDALVAVFPDGMKGAGLSYSEGITGITEDGDIRFIEEAPARQPLPDAPGTPETVKAAQAGDNIRCWGVERVNAPGAWPRTMGDGVKVAILDTGLDFGHPDLAANYAGGYNAVEPGTPPLDDTGHGTHVAGIVGAIKDGSGVAGVAPKVKLYAVRVTSSKGGTYSSIIDGLQWAVDNKMQVVNMSFNGGQGSPELAGAIKAAHKAGVTLVASAGNGAGPVEVPARYPEVIAVASSDPSDKLARDSARGPEIAFIAPGVDIPSTYTGGRYWALSGTSQAAPHVAGLAALAIAAGAGTPDEVRAALRGAASSLGLQPSEEGAGMIDAARLKGRFTE